MKKITYLFSLISLISIWSCKKFLDTKPTDFLSPVNYFNTEEHINLAVNSIYNSLYMQSIYGGVYPGRMNMMADEGFHARETEASGLRVYNYSTGDTDLGNFWKSCYEGISRANLVLENLNKPNMTDVRRSQVKGEALFLRGYFYFLLVQNFGNVPIILSTTTSPENTEVPQASIKQVYDQVLSDMEEAEPLVMGIRDLGFGGKVNKSAIRGILARVNLYMAGYPLKNLTRYVEARKWAKMVMDDTEANHALNPDFAKVFINYSEDKYDINESIWEAELWGNNSTIYNAFGRISSYLGIASNNTDIGVAYGFINATAKLYRLYDNNDLRRDWTISPFTYATNGTKNYYVASTNSQLYTRNSGKFRREYELVIPKTPHNSPVNFPILRYADVLLMFAEAENQLNSGPTQAAYDAINKVRERAYGTGNKVSGITITNQGSGYTSAPLITIGTTGDTKGSNRAIATATVTAGKVSPNITVVSPGGFYTAPPSVTISGGGGTGATATAQISAINPLTARLPPNLSQDDFFEAIQNERSIEFAFEALRKPDLIRWGIFISIMKQTLSMIQADAPGQYYSRTYENVSDRDLLYPIPAHEMTLNKALVQNPGW